MRRYPPTSIFSHFPVELVDEIARYSGVNELKALCLVSKQTGNVATRRLYDTIVLQTAKRAVVCLRTLAARQDVADCVKRIAIEIPSHSLFQGFYRLAAAALERTINLTALDVVGMDSLFALLVDVPFPRLIEVKLPYAPSLTPFLQSHRHTLKAVIVQGPDRAEQQEFPALYFKSVEMPELLTFVGPCTVIPFVIPKSQVSYLTACWDPGYEPPGEIARRVAESKRDIVGMDNLVVGWNPELLGIIGMHMPRMEKLRIRSVCSLTTTEVMEYYLLSLEEGFKKFKCLQTLIISLFFNSYQYELSDLDREYVLVRRWGSLLPTLKFCTLLSNIRWKRSKGNYWFPMKDSTQKQLRPLKRQWIFKAFLLQTYPSELLPEISSEIDFSGSEELILEDEAEEEETEEGEDESEEETEEEDGEGEGTDWNESEADVGSDWDDEGLDGSV